MPGHTSMQSVQMSQAQFNKPPLTTAVSSGSSSSTSSSNSSGAATITSPSTTITSPSKDSGRNSPQLYVWVVTMNREVTNEEFQRYISAIDPNLRRALDPVLARSQGAPRLATMRKIVADLLPRLLMMRQRIPTSRWRFDRNNVGKWYIDSPPTSNGKPITKVMGFGLAERDSLIGMAFAQGKKHQVVNIGMDIVRIPDHGSDEEAETFIASEMHKLAQDELSLIVPALPIDKKLSRLCIMLAVKEAYLKALGQPHGFDLSRISVSINPNGTSSFSVDGRVIQGWEFRLFTADIGVARAPGSATPTAASPNAMDIDVVGRPTNPDPRGRPTEQSPGSMTVPKLVAGAGPSGEGSSWTSFSGSSGLGSSVPPPAMGVGSGHTTFNTASAFSTSAPVPSGSRAAATPGRSQLYTTAAPNGGSAALSRSLSTVAQPPTARRPGLTASASVSSAAASVTGRTLATVAMPPGSGSDPASAVPRRLVAGQGPPGGQASTQTAPPFGRTTSAPSVFPQTQAPPHMQQAQQTQPPYAGAGPTHAQQYAGSGGVGGGHGVPGDAGIVRERYQCATAMWRGWKDRSEVIFVERERDEMSSWLQFLTVRALAKAVGSGGERTDPSP